MPQILALIIPRRRVKTLIWLTGIVVLVQCFVFVAVQVRSDKSLFVEDCSTLKSTGKQTRLCIIFRLIRSLLTPLWDRPHKSKDELHVSEYMSCGLTAQYR